jgi:cobalt-zinc-cadmium efflux system protein
MMGGMKKTSRWRSPHDAPSLSQNKKQTALLWALILSALALLGQAVGFFMSGSLALLGDTMHVFTDLLSLGMAFAAVHLTRSEPTEVRSFGWYRVEVLASFLNGLLLLAVAVGIVMEAIARLREPQAVGIGPLLITAVWGLSLNLLSAYLLFKSDVPHTHAHSHEGEHVHGHSCGHSHAPVAEQAHPHDRNLRSAMLHVMSDALGSCAVIVGGLLILWTKATWIDPAIGLGLAALVSYWSIHVIRDSIHVLLESTPKHIEVKKMIADIKACDAQVLAVSDLHVWEITSRMYAMTADIIVSEMSLAQADQLRRKLSRLLEERYGIAHPTLSMQLKRPTEMTFFSV